MATEFAAKVIESLQNDPVAYASFMAHWRIGMGRHLIARYFFGASLFEDPTTEAADRGILESIVFGYTFADKPVGVKDEIHKMLGFDIAAFLTYLVAPYTIISSGKDQGKIAEYFGLLNVKDLGYRPVRRQSYRDIIFDKCAEMCESFGVPVVMMQLSD